MILVSPEAVNIEPAILVNVNFRDVTDRGTIIPMAGFGMDMQMDAARQRIYIANYMQDQIEGEAWRVRIAARWRRRSTC